MDLLFVEFYHGSLEGLKPVTVPHAVLSIFLQFGTAAARTFNGLDDHPFIVVHFHPLSPRRRAWGSHHLIFFHFSKLFNPVNQKR
jgi:hydroxyacyl-ACP dehydratase HTD2-like protein with hotdog domain